MKEKFGKVIQQIRSYWGKGLDKVNSNIPNENKKQVRNIIKIIVAAMVVFFIISFIVTAESAKARQNELDSEVSNLKEEIENKEIAYNNLQTENKELALLEKEYKKYKEKMSPYESLEESEAEAKKAEADAKKVELEKKAADEKAKKEAEKKAKEEEEKAKEKAAADKKKKEEEEEQARLQAEEAKGYETGTTFDQLARTPDDYTFTKVKFSGKVVQVMEGEGTTQIRFAVNDDYDSIIYAEISTDLTDNNRVLEDDYITLSGTSMGLLTYESTMGGEITIPSINVDKIDR